MFTFNETSVKMNAYKIKYDEKFQFYRRSELNDFKSNSTKHN